MPLWLDFLRTPMAAPETPSLRRLRFAWQALCLTSSAVVGFIGPLRRVVGRPAPIAAGALLLTTLIVTSLYLLRKKRADDALFATGDGAE